MNNIKKTLCLVLTTLLLSGCNNQSTVQQQEDTVTSDEQTISFIQHGELLTASQSYYENGFLYFHDGQFLSYMNVESGVTNVLCWDPLCLHEEAYIDSDCKAITFNDGWLRVIADDGMIWFTAIDHVKRSDGYYDMVYQLRCLNAETDELTVYLEKNDIRFFDFCR